MQITADFVEPRSLDLRQMDGFLSRPADVPHIGADTPIGQPQWSTRNTKTASIFQ